MLRRRVAAGVGDGTSTADDDQKDKDGRCDEDDNDDDSLEYKPPPPPPRQSLLLSLLDWVLLLWLPLLSIGGLYWFSSAFFLAKKSLPHVSDCSLMETRDLYQHVLKLPPDLISSSKLIIDDDNNNDNNNIIHTGCWRNRHVDSMVVLVVDALRFDFAQYHFPLSIGARLNQPPKNSTTRNTNSQLFQFVADPPTVTMQRLKGLTTGSLPTFADISGNFGGAAIDEDSWVQQLKDTPYSKRGLSYRSQLGFVGDDTWVDLFPTQFEESYPYPSFNTRDLDTVDNGCLEHLPHLLQRLRQPSRQNNNNNNNKDQELEVIVAHFLGVDHVGHTYGPHDEHMDMKLRQMDEALSKTLNVLDDNDNDNDDGTTSDDCHLALIFGDHGMTEEGNHGGGTPEEVNAALFVHFSPGCQKNQKQQNQQQNNNNNSNPQSVLLLGQEQKEFAHVFRGSDSVEKAFFQSIHQIDLVPTISILLGLPIPYANLGGIVPSLLLMAPSKRKNNNSNNNSDEKNNDNHKGKGDGGGSSSTAAQDLAAALALNAAQVWRYFQVYSSTANPLPNLPELQQQLDTAVAKYQQALELLVSSSSSSSSSKQEHQEQSGEEEPVGDILTNTAFYEACGLFKLFLQEASELGHQVWTRFDTLGMTAGAIIVGITLVAHIVLALYVATRSSSAGRQHNNNRMTIKTWLLQPYHPNQSMELGLTVAFGIFQTFVLSFSNSYIEAEQSIVMFSMAVSGLAVFVRFNTDKNNRPHGDLGQGITADSGDDSESPGTATTTTGSSTTFLRLLPWIPVLVPLLSRCSESWITGHGLDPSLRVHLAHSAFLFIPSLLGLFVLRIQVLRRLTTARSAFLFGPKNIFLTFHAVVDGLAMLFLGLSWIEKRSPDKTKDGYMWARAAIALLLFCTPLTIFHSIQQSTTTTTTTIPTGKGGIPEGKGENEESVTLNETLVLAPTLAVISKLLIAIMVVTGPATATTVLLACFQGWMLYLLAGAKSPYEVNTPLQALWWRFLFRHLFFSTNHGCAFNRLQYSAAFVATVEFDFAMGGLQLFLNTFGWEVLGMLVVWVTSRCHRKDGIWRWYCLYQLLESFINCISVSVLRRHLMVWAVYAPRFLFSSIFLILNCLGQLLIFFLSFRSQ